MEKKKPDKKPPKTALVIDGRAIMDNALANQRVLDEIWRKHQEKEKDGK